MQQQKNNKKKDHLKKKQDTAADRPCRFRECLWCSCRGFCAYKFDAKAFVLVLWRNGVLARYFRTYEYMYCVYNLPTNVHAKKEN